MRLHFSSTGRTAVLLSLLAAPAAAAPILGTAGAGHQTVGPVHESGARFWDGDSWDTISVPNGGAANPCNAGSLAAGTPCALADSARASAEAAGILGPTFTLAGGDPGYQAWGMGDGSADLNFAFGAEPGAGLYEFTMLGEFTADWNVNEIGWYSLGNPLDRHTIFSASATTGTTAQVAIPTAFGFYYLNTSGNGEVFYTQSMFNTLGATNQQFAPFQMGDYTILGVEDIFSTTRSGLGIERTSDYDYNDVLFGFRTASVPEPGTLLLMGLGIAGAAWSRRRKAE